MEKNVLFSIPMFRGKKNGKKFIWTNFNKAVQKMAKEKLLFIEYFADIKFYYDGCQQILKKESEKLYLGSVKPYEELRRLALKDKWLKVPKDFLYDSKYEDKNFIYSENAREICEFPDVKHTILAMKYVQLLNKKPNSIFLSEEERKINNLFNIQKDVAFWIDYGNGFKMASAEKDLDAVLQNAKRQNFICIKGQIINYKFDASTQAETSFYIYAEEDRISPQEALRKSQQAQEISDAVKNGQQYFVFNQQRNTVSIAARSGIFVPRDTIVNKWKA